MAGHRHVRSQWLTNVFSDVITLKHNFVKSGVLQRKDLPQIWKAPAYPETVHDSLVALLEQFEVAYALPPTGSLTRPTIALFNR
jgi:hypothetical protein